MWPAYNWHGDVFDEWWTPLLEELPEFQFAPYDEHADVVLAEGHTGPLSWSGDDGSCTPGSTMRSSGLSLSAAGRPAACPVDAPARAAGSARRHRFTALDAHHGAVQEWEAWIDLALPESGDYVFPRGLAPLTVDRDGDMCTYWEPNVWMIHPELA
jgi:hypothetical protein